MTSLDLDATLLARGSTHGDFSHQAYITQALKSRAHSGAAWPSMTFVQREAVDMILSKLGRALSGDPGHADHWHDIAGYARLVEASCKAL